MNLFDYLFTVLRPAQEFFPVETSSLQNLGLFSALRALKQGEIFIMPHLQWQGASVFPVTSEGLFLSVSSYDTQGDVEDL
jgi:carbohydrate-selective porin OprB